VLTRLVLAVLVLAGCTGPGATAPGRASSSPPGSASPLASLPASAEATPTPEGSTPLAVPAGFPVHGSMRPGDPGARFIASWTSGASGADLYAFYQRELIEAGFDIELEAPGGSAAVIRFSAADGTDYQLDLMGGPPVAVNLGPPHP
jgi:hypothetical protein